MVTMDGFIISHAMEVVQVLEDKQVSDFVGTYKPERMLLDIDNPMTVGGLDFTDYYFEHRRSLAEPMLNVKKYILEIAAEYEKLTGRKYGLFEEYMMDDAEYAIVVLGSTAGTAKIAIDELRAQGVKAGMVKVRVFRPFPYDEIAEAIAGCKVVAVMDRSDGLAGRGGPVFGDVRSAICDYEKKPVTVNYVYGLGGRDINVDMIKSVYTDLQEIAATGKRSLVTYLGVRE
jgi:pyruvate ferredoxin oxidoreductase alpha subunit